MLFYISFFVVDDSFTIKIRFDLLCTNIFSKQFHGSVKIINDIYVQVFF